MATKEELLEREREALERLIEARGKYEASIASGTASAKQLKNEQISLTNTIGNYTKAAIKANKVARGSASLTGAQKSQVQAASKLVAAQTTLINNNTKSVSLNADAVQKLITAGIGLFGIGKAFNFIGDKYTRFVLPLDEQNLKLAESFGNVRDASGNFATNMGAQVAQETDALRQKILGLKVGLDSTTDASTGLVSPLRFLSPGMKGVKEAAEATAKTFVSLADKTAALVQGFDKSAENVLIFKKILNATDEDVGVFADRSIAMGTTIEAQMAAAAKATQKFSQNFGVNQKVLSTTVNTLRKDFVGFATFSEEALAKVAATALKLGVSLEGIKKLNMFDNFDQTAEKAAMLGQAFGINVDAFDLFAEQDPSERLRMLQEAATDAGVDVTQLGRIGLNYFADLTGGMNPQDVLKAFSPGNIGRFEEGITAAAAEPAATMEQQQQQLVELNQQLTKNASTFFQDFTDMIPQAVSTYAERLQAIEDSVFAGGTRPDRIRSTFGEVAGSIGGVAATLGGAGADAVINEHLGNLFQVAEDATEHVNNMVNLTGPVLKEMGAAINANNKLQAEMVKATNQVRAGASAVTEAVAANRAATEAFNAYIDATAQETLALGEDVLRGIDTASSKAFDVFKGLTDAAAGQGTTGAGISAIDKFMTAFDKAFGTTFKAQMTRLVDELLPELLKKIQNAGNDVVMNDGIAAMRDGFDASPMTIVTSGGKRIVTANDDEALIGQPGGMIQTIVETARESMRAARTITATSPMAMVGNQLAPEISRLTNEDQTLVVNLNLEMPVDFGDVRTQAVLTKATLSGQVEGANASLRQILERPNPEGVAFS